MMLSAGVITLGVLVTGSGPHAGDITAKRFHLDVRQIAWLHADSVIALLAMSLVTFLFIRQFEGEESRAVATKRLGIFLAIALSQGAIGYTQYFTGVPEVLVGMHMLGATLVWISITQFSISTNIWQRKSVTN
jgi:cytochrome c oxidase assembly protein subunit 15